jgi:hypothetical protein
LPQYILQRLDRTDIRLGRARPRHKTDQRTDRVGRRAGRDLAGRHELVHGPTRQQRDIESRALLDLLLQLARRTETERDFVAALALEQRHGFDHEPAHGAAAPDFDLCRY